MKPYLHIYFMMLRYRNNFAVLLALMYVARDRVCFPVVQTVGFVGFVSK
jgi:hypothetical protein